MRILNNINGGLATRFGDAAADGADCLAQASFFSEKRSSGFPHPSITSRVMVQL